LIAATILMLFGAGGNALMVVPDLHGDLIEIGVRRSVLGGTVLQFYFAVMAHFAFAAIVAAAAVQSSRGIELPRFSLAVIAVTHTVFGAMAFSRSHNPHHLGPLLMGLLVGAALLVPPFRRAAVS
jgi:hypothetical protein